MKRERYSNRPYIESKTQWFFPEEKLVVYKEATARRKGFQPIDYTPPDYVFGVKIYDAEFDGNYCFECDEFDLSLIHI